MKKETTPKNLQKTEITDEQPQTPSLDSMELRRCYLKLRMDLAFSCSFEICSCLASCASVKSCRSHTLSGADFCQLLHSPKAPFEHIGRIHSQTAAFSRSSTCWIWFTGRRTILQGGCSPHARGHGERSVSCGGTWAGVGWKMLWKMGGEALLEPQRNWNWVKGRGRIALAKDWIALGGEEQGGRAKRRSWSKTEMSNCPIAGMHTHLEVHSNAAWEAEFYLCHSCGVLKMPGKEMRLFISH